MNPTRAVIWLLVHTEALVLSVLDTPPHPATIRAIAPATTTSSLLERSK
jgi:hypothetical protein